MIIEDGTGTGNKAEVTPANHLAVQAITESAVAHASKSGDSYSWDSTELDIDVNDTMLFVKNLSATTLEIDRIIINGSNVICTWEILIGSASTTPAGTVVTGVNLDESSSTKLADVTALSDETAVAAGSIIARVKTPITNTLDLKWEGVRLGKNHYIQVDQKTESTSGSVIIIGHYDVEGN